MISIVSFMNEGVKHTNYVSVLSSLWLLTFVLYFLENLYLVEGCFHVVRRTFLYFDSDISIEFEIFTEPDCWEMSPSQFLYYHVSTDKYLSDMNGMVASDFIILDSLIFWIMSFVHIL